MVTNQYSSLILVILVIFLLFLRFGFEKFLSPFFKLLSLKSPALQLITRAVILIYFNVIFLALAGLLRPELFSFRHPHAGMVILTVGVGTALLVAALSFMALKSGYGSGYGIMAHLPGLEKGLTLATILLLAGPSEDIFFIGLVQNTLTSSFKWGAIIIYLVLFLGYHYATALSGVESKSEFMGTLPVRLVVAGLLGVSFYLTSTLVWGMIVHNLVDTLSYVVLIWTRSRVPVLKPV